MLWIELAGVATVGTLSLVMEEWFPDASVWSGYGIGYGFVPLALPIAGLLWLQKPFPKTRTCSSLAPVSPGAPPDVFAPATLGPVTLRNRTVKAATFEGRTPAGLVTDDLIDYHLAVAEGGVGLTTVAYLAVAPEGRTHREQILVGPATRPGLVRLAEAIHETGAAVAGQVGHAGPVANGRSNGVHAVSASRMPSPLSMQMVRPATEKDLTRITKAYVDTARILVSAGFDVLELHMAHSYLISSFLAPGLNRRKDEYGGSLENRAKLARQVARAVRDEVGDPAAVTAKVSVSDGFKGGVRTEDSIEFAQLLEADG